MTEVIWFEVLPLLPFIGFVLLRTKLFRAAREVGLVVSGLTLMISTFLYLSGVVASPGWFGSWWGWNLVHVDEFSGPLIPLTALIYFVTLLATVGHKTQQFSYAGALLSECLTLATMTTDTAWWMIILLSLGVLPMWAEIRSRGESTRLYEIHQGVFVVCLIFGWWFAERSSQPNLNASVVFLTIAVLIRSGAFPFHLWRIDMFEKGTFGSSILMRSVVYH